MLALTYQLARVVALVNRFDGLVNPAQPTVKSLTPHEALSLLFAQGRSRFDASGPGAFESEAILPVSQWRRDGFRNRRW